MPPQAKLLLAASLLLAGCLSPQDRIASTQPQVQVQNKPLQPIQPVQAAVRTRALQPAGFVAAPPPAARLRVYPQAGKARLSLALTLPRTNFSTQALSLGAIAFVKLTVRGIGIPSPLLANGADAQGMLAQTGGSINLNVDNVPFGKSRLVSLQFYDAARNPLPGNSLKGVLDIHSASSAIELSLRSSPAGEVVENLLAGSLAAQEVAARLDPVALQSLIDTLTGVSGTSPAYAYTTHPGLILAASLAQDLVSQDGNLAALNPNNPAYKQAPALVRFSLAGLENGRLATATLNDPASTVLSNLNNGGPYTLQPVVPGNWTLTLTAADHQSVTLPVNALSGQTLEAGLLTLNSTLPAITSLSAPAAVIGSSLQINGQRFDPVVGNNIVRFGSTQAVVTAASATQLSVTVPAGISDSQPVSVEVGGKTSNYQAFEIQPAISNLNPTAQTPGASLLILGSGFGNPPASNTVRFGATQATVSAATPTQLSVTVPAGLSGTQNITVQVGNQTSAAVAVGILPVLTGLSLSNGQVGSLVQITGTGFSSTLAENTVLLGSNPATVSAATPTRLDVTIPSAPTGNLSVQVGSQISNSLAFDVLPSVSLSSPLANASLSGTVPLTASFSSGNPVTLVEFLRDSNVSLGTDATAPYSLNWDSTSVSNGAHTLLVRISDNQGHVVTSAPINVTVDQSSLNVPVGQISFGTVNANLVKRLRITGPGGESSLSLNPGDIKTLQVQAENYLGQSVSGPNDYVWTFSATAPYPGYLLYPYNNQPNQANLNFKLGSGNVQAQVESLSTGLTATFPLTAVDVPTQITSFSISPAPVSNCSVSLPSSSDVICNVTVARNQIYRFTGNFGDGNSDLILTENATPATHPMAYQFNYGMPAPAVQNVAPPGTGYNFYLSGFSANLNYAFTSYAFSASGASGYDTKQMYSDLSFINATGGVGGSLRLSVQTSSGQTRNLTWNITVQ